MAPRALLAIGLVGALISGALAGPGETKLTAFDASAGDRFGRAVAADRDLAVMGAPGDNGGAGSAYVYVRCGGAWTLRAKLTASDAAAADDFGGSVAVSGDVVVVGARHNDDGGSDSGAAYVFVRDASGTWTERRKLTASDAASGDGFGSSVSVSGDVVVVGARHDDDSGSDSGSAYVFERDAAGTWAERRKLMASDAAAGDGFGASVSVSGHTAVVGAFLDDDGGTSSGSAYVFTRDAGGAWTERRKLTASDAASGDEFGCSVAISGDTAVVGAVANDDFGGDSGSAYVFTRDGAGTWTERQKLTASGIAAFDSFGWSVAVSGDTAVVGAWLHDGGGTDSGTAYVFRRDGAGSWTEIQRLTAPDAAVDDRFGYSVAVSGDTAVVGASDTDDGGGSSGSAYVFALQRKLTASDAAIVNAFGFSVAVSGDAAIVGRLYGTAYIFARDAAGTWTERQKLKPSSPTPYSEFGLCVAINGDTAVVADSRDHGNAFVSGSAYVFTRDAAGTWTESQRLTASDGVYLDSFGRSVAVSGDTIVVSTLAAGLSTPAIRPAFVFTRNAAGTWIESARLTRSDAAADDYFGHSVAVSGDTAVVAAPRRDDGGSDSGSAYVFVRDAAGNWPELQKLTASDAAAGDWFGWSVSVSGDVLVVGAPNDDDDGTNSGSAYVFTRDAAGAWTERQKLRASDAAPDAEFGISVAVSGGTAVVGAHRRAAHGAPGTGLAYVFTRNVAGTWTESQSLTATDASVGDHFGFCVSVSGDTAAVGAYGNDDAGADSGSAYVQTIDGAAADLEIVTASLPDATFGAAYRAEVRAAGGSAPRRYDLSYGTLPPALTLDRATGAVQGRCGVLGSWTFVVRVTDPCGRTATRPYSITVGRADAPPVIATTSLPAAVRDRPYAGTLEADHGTPPLSWSVSQGALPSGLTLDRATGAFIGRPDRVGRSNFTMRCVDATGVADERALSLDVTPLADLSKRRLTAAVPINLLNGTSPVMRPVELVAGTRLDVAVRFRAADAPPVTLDVVDATGQSVIAGAADKAARTGLRLTRIVVPATGRYFVHIVPQAPFEGVVVLSLAVKAPTRASDTVSIAAGQTTDLRIGTLAGARVSVTVKSARGTTAPPTVFSVEDDSGAELLVPSDLRSVDGVAILTMKAPVKGGTLTVKIGPVPGTRGGDFVWAAKIKQPRDYVYGAPDLPAGVGD